VLPASVDAQELRGKIVGRVVDPNGAAVPGAAAQVVDVARDKTTTLTTNSDGMFEAPYLLPGTYRILVEVAGFKKALQDNVAVVINQTTNLEIKLDVGTNPQETVTVTAEAAQLNTNDSNLGQTIDRKRLTNCRQCMVIRIT
jgi:preprotein translocase subunit SecD